MKAGESGRMVQVMTSVPSEELGKKIAGVLVGGRLAACVQVLGPMVSTYWWAGRIQTDREWLCLIKTRRLLVRRVEQAILAVHPYEVPEIIALPIVAGGSRYLAWLEAETAGARARGRNPKRVPV